MTNDAALVCHTLGLGKSQIASLLGVTRSVLYDYLKGRYFLPQRHEDTKSEQGCSCFNPSCLCAFVVKKRKFNHDQRPALD